MKVKNLFKILLNAGRKIKSFGVLSPKQLNENQNIFEALTNNSDNNSDTNSDNCLSCFFSGT